MTSYPSARAWFSVRPDHRDLRVGEHRRRNEPVIGLLQGLGVVPVEQQVLPDHAGLVVGDVLELVVRAHVAERENATRGGALVLVDDDAAVAHLDSGQLGVEQVAVGNPAGRNEQRCRPATSHRCPLST